MCNFICQIWKYRAGLASTVALAFGILLLPILCRFALPQTFRSGLCRSVCSQWTARKSHGIYSNPAHHSKRNYNLRPLTHHSSRRWSFFLKILKIFKNFCNLQSWFKSLSAFFVCLFLAVFFSQIDHLRSRRLSKKFLSWIFSMSFLIFSNYRGVINWFFSLFFFFWNSLMFQSAFLDFWW